MRETRAGITSSMAGCWHCGGSDARWHGKNALAVAARHHDATGHSTWCEQVMSVSYGPRPSGDSEQVDIEDYLAAPGAASS